MNEVLTGLGVLPEVQALFNTAVLAFDYGDAREYFDPPVHVVPTTNNLWLAGNSSATEIVVTSSAMEAIAYFSLNWSRHPRPGNVGFVALGNLMSSRQLDWVRSNYPKRKFTLAFGADLVGRATDIKVAARLKGIAVSLRWMVNSVNVQFKEKSFIFQPDELSLNAFELTFGVRTRIRTRKPAECLTFLDQLRYDTNR